MFIFSSRGVDVGVERCLFWICDCVFIWKRVLVDVIKDFEISLFCIV